LRGKRATHTKAKDRVTENRATVLGWALAAGTPPSQSKPRKANPGKMERY